MNSTAEIKISIALVTRNRPESLRRCLQSWRAQSVQPFEIVVSDDSDDSVRPEIHQIARQYEARWIAGPRRGLYANRNRVFSACEGTHIMSADDDHTFLPGYLELCFKAVGLDPDAVWTTGEIGFIDGEYYDRVEMANQLHPSGVGMAPDNPDDNWTISDGSTIYPASVFQKGLRMVEDYGYGSSYLEFGIFLHHHGYRSRCIKGAVVEHFATKDTLDRMNTYYRPRAASLLFACLAYNLYFKRNLAKAWSCGAKIILRSRLDPALICELPRIISAARKRWKQTPQKA
jgi:glycosyltransferase involved in cell wall biosynthesis